MPAVVLAGCIIEPPPLPGPDLRNDGGQEITVYITSPAASGVSAYPVALNPGESSKAIRPVPDSGDCLGTDTGNEKIVIYAESLDDFEHQDQVREDDMRTEPVFSMGLGQTPMCDGETWVWNGRSLEHEAG